MLMQGRLLVVDDQYSGGLRVLDALDAALPAPAPDAPFAERQAAHHAWQAAASRLLVPVVDHRVDLPGASESGFLAELYPELTEFFLPLVDARDLRRAWLRYQDGVHLPVLGYALHPFYGTYLPARHTHLELFAQWLAATDGPRARAADVGTGCGVLAFLLARAGFQDILATDLNENAVESVRRELQRHPAPIDPRHVDLLGEGEADLDLVVCNPPWTHGVPDSPLSGAMLFDDGFFPRLFDQALARLSPGGRLVLLFSNLITLVQPDVPHPIDAELARGRFSLAQKLRRRVKPPDPEPGQRARRTRERVEVWELARA